MPETPHPAPVPYGEFVDWDKRLDREGPFFRHLFEERGVRRVVDMGAGSARHAIMFATWGLEVIAVDPGESMLAEARQNLERFGGDIAVAAGRVELLEGGFGDLAGLRVRDADALVCTGNALPHVAGVEGLRTALADFAGALRPGGLLVLHLLNHDRLLARRERAIMPKVRDTDGGGVRVFMRLIGYAEDDSVLDFDFVTLTRDAAGSWDLSSRRSEHTVITLDTLRAALRGAGFVGVEFFGDHNGRPLDVDGDESVIVVARLG